VIPSNDKVNTVRHTICSWILPPISNDQCLWTSVEVYYKEMKNRLNMQPEPSWKQWNDNADNNFVFGKGWSYGAEFFVKKARRKRIMLISIIACLSTFFLTKISAIRSSLLPKTKLLSALSSPLFSSQGRLHIQSGSSFLCNILPRMFHKHCLWMAEVSKSICVPNCWFYFVSARGSTDLSAKEIPEREAGVLLIVLSGKKADWDAAFIS